MLPGADHPFPRGPAVPRQRPPAAQNGGSACVLTQAVSTVRDKLPTIVVVRVAGGRAQGRSVLDGGRVRLVAGWVVAAAWEVLPAG
jgi:hypothetical protein